ncbi:MAG: M20 family metallopeptidase [Deltaproteobacteria bacterium]|nr:MAG: M20 family metallopeptidase [Deltaproteobacteria bacterium]
MIPDETIEKVLNEIDPDELIKLTAELVRINSVWDPAAGTSEQLAAEKVAQWAHTQEFEILQEEVAPGRPNVVITWPAGSGDRKLMFEGHTDVVTPGDVSEWSYDPFGAEIVGRRMYGRGANDTKGNLAAMLVAMKALKKSGVKLAGTIVEGVLCDEEDQMLGVRDFIDRGHADAITAAVICEPQDGLICISQKGALRARYTVSGRMSHGAMPLAGLNCAPAMARLIDGLHKLELEAVTKMGHDRYLGWPSFTPTVIQAPMAGTPQLNVMPGRAQVLVDIRTIPTQSHSQIKNNLKTLANEIEKQVCSDYERYDRKLDLKRTHDLKIEVEFLTDRPCTMTDRDDPIVQAADWATRNITGKEPIYAGVPGATDGTYLWALKRIPIVTMGGGDRQVPHQVNEWIDLDQLIETAKIYAITALHYLYPRTDT